MNGDTKQVLIEAKKAIDSAVEKARRKRNEEDRKFIVAGIGTDLARILQPLLVQIAANSRLTREDIKSIIKEIRVEAPQVSVGSPKVEVTTPEVIVPQIIFPKEEMIKAIRKAFAGVILKAPEVKVKVDIPEIKFPKINIKVPTIKPPVIPDIVIPEIPAPIVNITTPGSRISLVTIKGGAKPTIYNLAMAGANTEYSYDLPEGTKKLDVKLRALNTILKIAFTLGHSGTQYVTIPYGSSYHLENINLNEKTLYVQSPSAAQTCEIVAWT